MFVWKVCWKESEQFFFHADSCGQHACMQQTRKLKNCQGPWLREGDKTRWLFFFSKLEIGQSSI